jgi:trehalose-phosphatase
MEIAWGKAHFRHPAAAAHSALLRRVAREVAQRGARLRGVLVEPKGLALAIHYRLADRAARRELRALAEDVAARAPTLEVLNGKQVLEVRPRVAWGKGEAVRLLRQRLGASLRRRAPVTLYLGDDAGDDAAFRALRREAFCVAVGRRRSPAPFRLRDPGAVGRFLAWLEDALADAGGVRP